MKTRSIFLSLLIILASPLAAQPVSPVRLDALSTEHQQNPIGIGDTAPRFSWKLLSDRQGEVQSAYEIRAASTAALLKAGQGDLWSSGKVASDQSVLVPWGGPALASRAQVFWQVRVWDKDGVASAWSDPATFELGLLNPATDWKGQWITVDLPRFDIEAAPLAKASWITGGATAAQGTGVRLGIDLPADAKILDAHIDVSADGLIAIYANGQPTRQGSSSHTAPFHANFGQNLQPGHNVLAILSGGVRGNRGGGGRDAIAAHVEIVLADGQQLEFYTDGSWKAGIVPAATVTGPSATAIPAPGSWATPEFDDSTWAAATVLGPYPDSKPVASADSTIGAGRYLRKTFTIKGPIAKARLYSTAFGVYEASLNGQRVNDHQLDPGFTSYDKRVMVQTTDVTNLLKPGSNALGVVLGDGWFAGRLGWMGLYQYKQVSDHPSFNAQLEIIYADGSKDVIATDNTWKGGPGEVTGADEQLGEVIDDHNAVAFDQPDFNDAAWTNATVEDHSAIPLVPQLGPAVRELMELTPKKITRQGNLWLVDFGQNMVGHIRLSVSGSAGSVIKVSHGEMLNPDGTLYNENLRPAISLDEFVLKGGGVETFEPRFTFHGFRYALIQGYPGELTADNVRGIVVGSDVPMTGTWESSDSRVNQIFSNIQWSQRGNFLSIPTDCPQRDERLGWMGDAEIFSPTAALDADAAAFFQKWMVDVDDSQSPEGGFTAVSPVANQNTAANNNCYAIWGDAGVIVPWVMYQTYGDKKFLSDNYANMARWITFQYNKYPTLLVSGGVGDNLAPNMTGVGPGAAAAAPRGTAAGVAAAGTATGGRGAGARGAGGAGAGFGARGGTAVYDTAYYANSIRILAKSAAALGRTDDATGYEKLYQAAVQAFDDAYLSPDGTVTSDTQTAYALAIQFNLVPDNLRAAVAQKLLDNIARYDHLSTGFVGCAWICPALTTIGHSDTAWKLVFTDTFPSWLFEVKNGATTIWEHWDGWTPERGFMGSSENSFNHYSEGEIGYWFYSDAAGIQLDDASPGYKHFLFVPQFTNNLTYVKSSIDSAYGKISSYWHVEGDQMVYDVTVPPNSSATLRLPFPTQSVKQGGQPLAAAAAPTTSLPLAAGSYQFSFPRALIK